MRTLSRRALWIPSVRDRDSAKKKQHQVTYHAAVCGQTIINMHMYNITAEESYLRKWKQGLKDYRLILFIFLYGYKEGQIITILVVMVLSLTDRWLCWL